MEESDILYIAEKIGLITPINIADKQMYLVSPHVLVEDVIVFAETVLYEWEEIREIHNLINQYEIGDIDDSHIR